VNYGISVEEGMIKGRYDWVDPNIISRHFPAKHRGKTKITMELIHFNRTFPTDMALREIEIMGFRPAELRELFGFGEKYPDLQRDFPVVALGSVWQGRVPYLDGDASERVLDLEWLENDWCEFCRFAAVRQ
jgi:hypothetical protein